MAAKKMNENRDRPSRKALHRFYSQGWESIWLEELDDQLYPVNEAYRRRMEATFDALGLPAGEAVTVLDAGCGIGIYAINLAKRWPEARILGFDISARQIEIANRLSIEQDVAGRCQFFVGDINEATLSETFDFIICSEVLEHLPNPTKQALDNLKAIGARDSVYVFSVPQFYHGRRQSGVFYKQVLPNGQEVHTQDPSNLVKEVPVYEYYHALYKPREFMQLLQQHGFSITRMEGVEFTIPSRSIPSGSDSLLNIVNRALNVAAKGINALAAHLGANGDRCLNRMVGNRLAANLIVRSRLS